MNESINLKSRIKERSGHLNWKSSAIDIDLTWIDHHVLCRHWNSYLVPRLHSTGFFFHAVISFNSSKFNRIYYLREHFTHIPFICSLSFLRIFFINTYLIFYSWLNPLKWSYFFCRKWIYRFRNKLFLMNKIWMRMISRFILFYSGSRFHGRQK